MHFGTAHVHFLCSKSEVESRTQGSRPRTQKKIRGQGQGQPFRGQTLSRPRTKDTSASALQKKKKGLHKNFFQAISTKKHFLKNFSSAPQNFNNSKNSAVLEPRTGQFSTGCRTVSNNVSGSGLAPAQNILAIQVYLSSIFEVQVWFGFTQVKYYWVRFGSGSLT